jgi:hypothetical protein
MSKQNDSKMDPKIKEDIKKFLLIEQKLDEPEYIVNTLFPKTRKGFADGREIYFLKVEGISLQLNDMVDSFFGYFGNFIGGSLAAFIFAQPVDNKLRIKLQKNNFFQKNYTLRYLLVAPIVAVPGKNF